MSRTIFMRNRQFIRSIPGVGRDIHRAHVAATCDPIPFYLSRADEIAQRKMTNRLNRMALQTAGESRWQMIRDAINNSVAAGLARAGKKDELDRLK